MIRIAVVDDNEMIRKQVKRFLNTYALKNSVVFEIYTYEDGHLLTLDINHEMHFDLIYLDIEMPIQNGIQVGHWIREIAQDEWMQIVFISGKEINLTAKEFDVLELLVFNPNKVYSRENLLNIVWGYEYPGDVRTVDVHIRRLREKIEANPSEPKYVHTKWGVGYYFQA